MFNTAFFIIVLILVVLAWIWSAKNFVQIGERFVSLFKNTNTKVEKTEEKK